MYYYIEYMLSFSLFSINVNLYFFSSFFAFDNWGGGHCYKDPRSYFSFHFSIFFSLLSQQFLTSILFDSALCCYLIQVIGWLIRYSLRWRLNIRLSIDENMCHRNDESVHLFLPKPYPKEKVHNVKKKNLEIYTFW